MAPSPVVTSENAAVYTNLLDPRPWYKNTRLIVLNFWIAIMLTSSATLGYDGSLMNGLQSLTQWNVAFGYPTGGTLGLLNAIQNIGSLCAYPVVPYVADGLGRRFSIALGASLMTAAAIIQTASQSVEMFIGARFLIGFGCTFGQCAAPLLISEVAYPSHRAQATSLYGTLWYLGSIIAAWTTYGTYHIPTSWAWRIPSALQGLPSVIQLVFVCFIPESPRWLVSKSKEDRALKILAYYHADGNERNPLVEYQFEEIKAAVAFDRRVVHNVGWCSLIATPGNRKRLRVIVALGLFSQWSGNGLVSYYLNKVFNNVGITDPKEQLLINGVLMIFNLIVAIVAASLCERVGRRPLFLISCAGMLVFWTAQTICFAVHQQTGSVVAGHAVVVFIFLYFGFYDIAFTPLVVAYPVEILPYGLRAKGLMALSFTISLALVINQYVNPIALDVLQWKYYLIYVFWLCFELIFCYFFVVETKNRTLEETAALFDDDEGLPLLAGAAGYIAVEDMEEEESDQNVEASSCK